MTWIFTTGSTSTACVAITNATQMWLLKELLKNAGWVIQASSDGTNVSNTPGNVNDQIANIGEMNTNNAWYVIKQPTTGFGAWGRAGGRQIIVRRGSSSTSWMVVYVPLDDDEAAQSPTANGDTTHVPTFTKSVALVGTLPDTTAAFTSSTGTSRVTLAAMDVAPYGFFMGAWANDGTPTGGCMFLDPLEPDSVDPEDEDPYVVAAFNSNPWLFTGGVGDNVNGPQAYWRKGLTGELFGGVAGAGYCINRTSTAQRAIPGDVGRSPIGMVERTLPVWYMKSGTNGSDIYSGVGVKGVSSIWRYKNGGWISGTRRKEYVDNDRIVIGDCLLPWDPSITPHWGA